MQYKKLLLAFLLQLLYIFSFAQNNVYSDENIGWMKIYHYKGATKSVQVDEKLYSIAQLSILDSFGNWMQQTYYPKGGLGDIKKYVTPKKNEYHERYNEGVPESYGTAALIYTFLKKQNDKWVPENNLGFRWSIVANEIPMGYRLEDFNTDKVCLFTLPLYDKELITEQPNSEEAKEQKLYDVSTNLLIQKYTCYQLRNYNQQQTTSWIILSKNNKAPYIAVTIGEALQFAEDALPVKLQEQKQSIAEHYPNSPNDKDYFTKQLIENFDKAKQTLQKLKDKYSNRLNEPAYSRYGDYSVTDLVNGKDIFTGTGITENGAFDKSFPILRVDPAMQKLCSTDKPQWIVIRWDGGNLDDPSYKYFHESILENFDFDYVYNFFFDPEKVKGKAYKPLHNAIREEKIIVTEKSAEAKKMEANADVFFFEDFSATAVGQKPNGWKSDMSNDAKYTTVVTPAGLTGKWLEIKGQSNLTPAALKKPLPENFELSFDLAAPKDIPWGAKGLTLYLGTANKYEENGKALSIKFRAGFSGRAGEITLMPNFGGDYFAGIPAYYDATGFSNNKDMNMVKVTIKKQNNTFQLMLNGNIVANISKAFPANTLFNCLQFSHPNSNSEAEKYFISNFKITRLQ